ncbi:MAG: HTTM domain-containing protein [Sphingobacteriales bacterium]|nr:MAG: HTTM domain-containing protein [Sphingobacteriales bacterium]
MHHRTTYSSIQEYLGKPVYSASLALFRAMFGFMLLAGIIRFWAKGWIYELYIAPKYFFHYYGFEWVQPLGNASYVLFAICGLAALCFALGFFYRVSAVVLFLSFTWIELLDKTNYLNHYYFVTLVLFLMIWLPAHVRYSVDAFRNPGIVKLRIPLWTLGSIRLMVAIVYIYAGLAKLNSDWLLEGMPLRLWLPAKNDVAFIGPLFNHAWVAYVFSWFGAFYDLTIVFFLLNARTRFVAFATVVLFHIMTAVLFPIGMFPYIMIFAATVFFDSRDVQQLMDRIPGAGRRSWDSLSASGMYQIRTGSRNALQLMLGCFFVFQLLFPWRYLLTDDELFWTEEGYRFSWRVMLMEKTGYAQFIVRDRRTGESIGVNNNDFLTKNQEKMMATQPDFILQYASLLHSFYKRKGMQNPEVKASIYVTLNGRRSRLFTDQTADLSREKDSFKHKNWILAFNDEIYGL